MADLREQIKNYLSPILFYGSTADSMKGKFGEYQLNQISQQIIALFNQWLGEQGAKHRVCIQVTETGPVDGATTIVTRDEPLRIPSPE